MTPRKPIPWRRRRRSVVDTFNDWRNRRGIIVGDEAPLRSELVAQKVSLRRRILDVARSVRSPSAR
jgi:hypothetical protein